MELEYDGKTKRILRNGKGLVLKFKDTVVGDSSGSVDPGGNIVVDEVEGKAEASAQTSAHFFTLLEEEGVSTHFLEVLSPTEIRIQETERYRLEVIYRRRAYGSFLSRYGGYVEPFQELDLVEFSLKDDDLRDPFLTEKAVLKLDLASEDEVREMKRIIRKVASIINDYLEDFELQLVDMKLEFGELNDEILVIDEISGDTMRVYDPGIKKILNQVELAKKLTSSAR